MKWVGTKYHEISRRNRGLYASCEEPVRAQVSDIAVFTWVTRGRFFDIGVKILH